MKAIKRRMVCLAAVFCMLVPVGVSADGRTAHPSATDPSDWAKESVYIIKESEAADRKFFGLFKGSIRRDEFAMLLARSVEKAVGFDIPQQEQHFVDMTSARYPEDIQKLLMLNVMLGESVDRFNPAGKITREQVSAMLYRMYPQLERGADMTPKMTRTFTDEEAISEYARDAVHYMAELGTFEGYPDGSFNPQGTLTREQAMVLVHRMLAARGYFEEHAEVPADYIFAANSLSGNQEEFLEAVTAVNRHDRLADLIANADVYERKYTNNNTVLLFNNRGGDCRGESFQIAPFYQNNTEFSARITVPVEMYQEKRWIVDNIVAMSSVGAEYQPVVDDAAYDIIYKTDQIEKYRQKGGYRYALDRELSVTIQLTPDEYIVIAITDKYFDY